MASTRAVLQVFEKYQKDRVAFVQTVAELATRPQNIEPMQSAGVGSAETHAPASATRDPAREAEEEWMSTNTRVAFGCAETQ